jgi:hypothetical protein
MLLIRFHFLHSAWKYDTQGATADLSSTTKNGGDRYDSLPAIGNVRPALYRENYCSAA